MSSSKISPATPCDVCAVPARQLYDNAGRPRRRLCTTHAGPAGWCRVCHQLNYPETEPFVCPACQSELFAEIMAVELTDADHQLIARQKATQSRSRGFRTAPTEEEPNAPPVQAR